VTRAQWTGNLKFSCNSENSYST